MICCRMSRSTCLKHVKTRCSAPSGERKLRKTLFYQICWRCTPRRTNEICLICFDGHGPQKKDVVIYDQSILFAQKTHPSKHQHHVFSTSKSHRFQAPPNPPTPPSAPAPLAAPRPQRGRGGARSQPHPGSQRLHHPCPGGRLAQHPVPRDGSSTTSPGPE